uniref:F-box domain-containing protein n=1 Tax=Pithovirus LCPAC401 TaxID=2506595 RepID=A0A481ZC49_9VIRU|nr:MAG: uncharacterized protein LCPAC401_02970 [Pithovirus LCPAC401]
MSDINEILKRLRLSRRAIDALSPDQIDKIFLDLNVKDILVLCRISRKFNFACGRESLWKAIVLGNYGISEKLRGETWRGTAKIFAKNNMINLDKEWINGMTYKELLEKADSKGEHSLTYLYQLKNLLFYHDLEMKVDVNNLPFYADTSAYQVDADFFQSHFEPEVAIKLDIIGNVLTRELGVVAAAIATRYYSYPDLPQPQHSDAYVDNPGLYEVPDDTKKNTDERSIMLDKLFDYNPYLLNYSSYDHWALQSIIYPGEDGF